VVPDPAYSGYPFCGKVAADKPARLDGRVSEFKFQDPHSLVKFDVVDKDGRVSSWIGELRLASTLTGQEG